MKHYLTLLALILLGCATPEIDLSNVKGYNPNAKCGTYTPDSYYLVRSAFPHDVSVTIFYNQANGCTLEQVESAALEWREHLRFDITVIPVKKELNVNSLGYGEVYMHHIPKSDLIFIAGPKAYNEKGELMDIKGNTEYTWDPNREWCKTSIRAEIMLTNNECDQQVLVHEMGHALGYEHSPNKLSYMYFQVSDNQTFLPDEVAQMLGARYASGVVGN